MKLLHHLLFDSAASAPERAALLHGSERLSYAELATLVSQAAAGLVDLGVERGERVAVYLPKQREAVAGMFAASAAGAVFVPVNPVLKPAQVGHILRDCGARVLITSGDRARSLDEELTACP